MFDVDEIVQLHDSTVASWHQVPIANDFVGPLKIICQQHIYNFELWHEEDIARSPNVSDREIARVKRSIDRLNQARNDHIEQIDDWIAINLLQSSSKAPNSDIRQHTETPGSVVDRLSIMSLRIFHYAEQCERPEVSSEHLQKVRGRLAICREQRADLANSLKLLLEDIVAGRSRHKIYRQFKMYNDPTLNPYLYGNKTTSESD